MFVSIGIVGPQPVPNNLSVCMEMEDFNKEMNEIIAKQIFGTISSKYLQYEAVYTDASVSESGVGVGIYMPRMNVEKCFKVNESVCIMNAELIGMLEGLRLAVNEGNRKIVVFSDSQSGMRLIKYGGGKEGNVYVDLIIDFVRLCQCDVTIQWVPSHRQIKGNERADMLAKNGGISEVVQEYGVKDGRDVLRMFQENLWSKWESEYSEKSLVKGKKYKQLCDVPLRVPFFKTLKGNTRMIRTIERIRLNHGNWKECLWKRRMSEDNVCELCGSVEDIEHVILMCPKYSQYRQAFNILRNARDLIRLMKVGGIVYKELYEFIRISGITV